MMAAVGTGLKSSYQVLANEWIQIESIESPDPALVDRYCALYRDFHHLEAATRGLEARLPAEG
jgi:hypothetical protein